MQMIATSKFARAQQASTATKPYTETLFQLVTELASGLGDLSHPLLDSGKGGDRPGKPLTLVLTSDRGLCGPYNGAVLRNAMQLFRTTPGVREGIIELVGRKGVGFLKFTGIPVARHHSQFGDKPSYDAVRTLAEEYVAKFLAGEVSRVRVVYMRYISAGRQTPTVMQLLPFQTPAVSAKGEKSKGINTIYEFSPSATELLDTLLPAAVKAMLFQAFNDAVVSEHVARMVAMKAATDNAGKMGKTLTRKFNRARQSQITTELTEIISGAAALE
jgi:F-type H+-transporting ATPase subunit gamma